MLIDPRHLEQISIIVQTGTLQAAAERAGTSQPALSRMIRTLESRIGQPLFERDRRPLRPTSLGLELACQGRAILIARERAVELVDQSQRGVFGVLKIGAPPFICERLVAEAISDFLAFQIDAAIWESGIDSGMPSRVVCDRVTGAAATSISTDVTRPPATVPRPRATAIWRGKSWAKSSSRE